MLLNNNIDSVEDDNYFARCENGHDFHINRFVFNHRKKFNITICTKCNPVKSYWNSEQENNLFKYIKTSCDEKIIINYKLPSRKEIDIYLPDLKLAFEFNGLYWHNELYKQINYHKNKTEECEKMNIKLIHVYEDDWLYKEDIVKSKILNLIGKSNKIMARKCVIRNVNDELSKSFLIRNHLQGFVKSDIKLGLFFNNELVSLMSFNSFDKKKDEKNIYDMNRFCNKLNFSVVGGASKLFKHFIKIHKPVTVISYADRSWSNGNLYEKLGFKFIHNTEPDYCYVIRDKRFSHVNFIDDLSMNIDINLNITNQPTELKKKMFKIYNSGNLKFEWNNEELKNSQR
jgi:hypothetical protein